LVDGPRLVVAGRDVSIPESGKPLLALLGLRREPVARRLIARQLWPDADDERAGGNLRSALWRLRRAGIDLVDTQLDTVALRHHVRIDLDHLLSWSYAILNEAAAEADLVVPPGCLRTLNLLSGWYADWVLSERERVRHVVLRALEVLSCLLSARHRHAEAIEAAISAVCAEPLRESAQRALIVAHTVEGNWGEAQRALDRYAALLWRDLGVRPSPDIVAVARQRSSGSRTPRRETSTPSPPTGCPDARGTSVAARMTAGCIDGPPCAMRPDRSRSSTR
jgi:DNA-binding SARP family transcriptional activator